MKHFFFNLQFPIFYMFDVHCTRCRHLGEQVALVEEKRNTLVKEMEQTVDMINRQNITQQVDYCAKKSWKSKRVFDLMIVFATGQWALQDMN